jgi:hypothetical protein
MPALLPIVQSAGLMLSFAGPVAAAPPDADCSPLGPRAPATSVAYRLHAERRGTKESGLVDTTLTLSATANDMTIASTAPALNGKGVPQPDGSLDVQGDLVRLIDPYNQVATSLHCVAGAMPTGESKLLMLLGKNTVDVPVKIVTAPDGPRVAVAITGETDTTMRSAHVHLVVNVHAMIVDGKLLSASADNNLDASVMFRKIHVEQLWSLNRVQ